MTYEETVAHPMTPSSSSSSNPHLSPPAWNYAPAPSSDPLNFASFVPLFASTDVSPMFLMEVPFDLYLNRSRAKTSKTDQTSITPRYQESCTITKKKKGSE
jgi:nuclear pore complex protein Nup98-Nup96